MKLPVNVNKEEIEIYHIKGTVFTDHIEFIKQTIINALANSEQMRYQAIDQIAVKLEGRIGRKLEIITFEFDRGLNSQWEDIRSSRIVIAVKKGLIIVATSKQD